MALLAMNEEELLQSEDDSVLSSRFRWERRGEVRRRQMGQFLFDVDALLGLAYKKHNPLLGDTSFFPFKRMEIERMRETKRREILGKAVWASSTRVVIDSDDDLGVCCVLIITSNLNSINPQQVSILSIHNKSQFYQSTTNLNPINSQQTRQSKDNETLRMLHSSSGDS